jgi:bacteriorhodopsin
MATYAVALLEHVGKHLPQDTTMDVYSRLLHQHYWTRYVDWSLTIPLTLVMLSLVAELDATSIFAIVVAAVIMVLTSFIGMFSHNKSTIGW